MASQQRCRGLRPTSFVRLTVMKRRTFVFLARLLSPAPSHSRRVLVSVANLLMGKYGLTVLGFVLRLKWWQIAFDLLIVLEGRGEYAVVLDTAASTLRRCVFLELDDVDHGVSALERTSSHR